MTPIKIAGKIYGAKLTAAEQQAVDMEIKKQLAEYDRKNSDEIDALVLWILRTEFGFGEARLRRFHDVFGPGLDALCERYEMPDCDCVWLCTQKLKDDGIDISKWNKEISNDK